MSLDEARAEITQAGYHCAAAQNHSAPQASQSIRARHNALCQKAAGAVYLPGQESTCHLTITFKQGFRNFVMQESIVADRITQRVFNASLVP